MKLLSCNNSAMAGPIVLKFGVCQGCHSAATSPQVIIAHRAKLATQSSLKGNVSSQIDFSYSLEIGRIFIAESNGTIRSVQFSQCAS